MEAPVGHTEASTNCGQGTVRNGCRKHHFVTGLVVVLLKVVWPRPTSTKASLLGGRSGAPCGTNGLEGGRGILKGLVSGHV